MTRQGNIVDSKLNQEPLRRRLCLLIDSISSDILDAHLRAYSAKVLELEGFSGKEVERINHDFTNFVQFARLGEMIVLANSFCQATPHTIQRELEKNGFFPLTTNPLEISELIKRVHPFFGSTDYRSAYLKYILTERDVYKITFSELELT